jgi:hypothetical protein
MQRKSLFVILATAVVLIVSCGRADKSAMSVPKDAAVVVHINSSSLSSKLTWKEIQQTNWFKEVYADADDSLAKKLLDNPDNSGIDTKGDLVFFLKRQGKSGYSVFEGSLKDAAAFEAFNKKMKPEATASKDGDISILKLGEGIATWKDGRFIYVFDAPFLDMSRFTGSRPPGDGSSGPTRLTADSLVAFAKGLYNLKGDNSLGNDDKFVSLLKENGDVHLWLSAEQLYGNMITGMLSMMKFSTLLEGNITAMTLNFDNGKIDIKSKSYYNKELGKLYEKYKMKNIDADVLARISAENVVGVFAMNYPPEGLKEFLKMLGVDGMANGFMGEMGYSVDEFVKANKGDLIVAVSDFEIKTVVDTMPAYEEGAAPYTYTKTDPSAKVLFAVSINDKPAFDKMVGIVKAKMGEIPEGSMPKISYTLNDKWFAAGNSEEQVNKFVAGGANNKQAFVSKLAGHPAGMYVDLQKILKTSEAAADSSSKAALTESVKLWEDILFTYGELGNGAMSSHCEINFVDKNTNSLKQLNQYADKLAATRKRGF